MGIAAVLDRCYQLAFKLVVVLMERGLVPDFVIRRVAAACVAALRTCDQC